MTSRQHLLQLPGLVLAASLIATTGFAHGNTSPPVIVTDAGPVRGFATAIGSEFLGIPYAAAPVGERRWQPPAPVARWSRVREATQFGSGCPQFGTPFGLQSFNEDCLFLNVFTPPRGRGADRDPVMVWFHPGAFQFGESDDYDPTELVKRGVVVVTVNYRLGALGFLAHPALTSNSTYSGSGNYGLMDQQAALRWVQRNIKRFGGDPDNVMIFGTSAGGLSVHAHLTSRLSRGLFHRASVQSGAYTLQLPSLDTAEAQGTAFATAVGCADQSLACLRAVPVQAVLANQIAGALGILPNLDGRVLTQSFDDAFASGRFNRVPVIEGATHDEFRLFVPLFFDFATGPVTAEAYPFAIQALLGVSPTDVPAIVERYPLASYPSPGVALAAAATDKVFACNMHTAARLLSRHTPTWVYEFNDTNAPQLYLPPASFPYGASHEAEIQYLFNVTTALPAPALDREQERLSAAMVSYWTHFAFLGNPNGLATPLWPRHTPIVQAVQSLVAPRPQFTFGAAFDADHRCDFWETVR